MQVSTTKKNLSEYVDLRIVIKNFNNKFAHVYPKFTKSKVIELCAANSIPLYSFSSSANIRSRIYISRLVNLEDLIAEDLFQVFQDKNNEE